MSRPPLFSNTIHIRDFVDSVVPDPGRENTSNYVEIHTDVNIFKENDFFSHDIVVEPIRARIHTYLSSQEQNLYCPDAFFYADGRFSAIQLEDGTLELNIQSLSLMRCVPSLFILPSSDPLGIPATLPTSTSTGSTYRNSGAQW
jgi:hypothetical protein